MRAYVDGPDELYAYPDDYLPGASLGAMQTHGGIHLQEADKFGVTLAARQAFNWTFENLCYDRRATDLQKPLPGLMDWVRNSSSAKAGSVLPLQPWVFSNVVQFATEATAADTGTLVNRDVEPGTSNLLVFDYVLTSGAGNYAPRPRGPKSP